MNYLVSSPTALAGIRAPVTVEKVEGMASLSMAFETIERERPDIIQACYPRRYPAVAGYPSPRFFATSAFSHACNVADPARCHDKTAVYSFCVSMKLVALGVPTYFIGQELAESLAMTSPPEDMSLDELEWPLEGMMFMLPLAFSRRYFGVDVLHLSVVRVRAGEKIDCPFSTGLAWEPYVGSPNSDAMIMSASTVEPNGLIASFHSIVPLGAGQRLNAIMAAAFEYFGHMPDAPDEGLLVRKMVSSALNYMLVMSSAPEWLTPAACTRPAKKKHGRVRDALWSPHFIGRDYRHPVGPPQGGTHASPRMHWRKGHWHTFRCGPGRAQTRRKLIAAVLVNAHDEPVLKSNETNGNHLRA